MVVEHSIYDHPATEKFGCLTILGRTRIGKRLKCWCRCDCGAERWFREDRIKCGRIVSCGCKRSRIGRTHGGCRGRKYEARTYRAWASMLSRCNNTNHKNYAGYGGRGIRVCERWSGSAGYPSFLADMGEPATGMSLDRINNDGDYEPDNCRWASRKEQQRNTRRNRLIACNGKTQPLAAWAEEVGLEEQTISCRLIRGWSVERALTTPSLKPQMKGLTSKRYGG